MTKYKNWDHAAAAFDAAKAAQDALPTCKGIAEGIFAVLGFDEVVADQPEFDRLEAVKKDCRKQLSAFEEAGDWGKGRTCEPE